jgi:membrane-bound lytic murein transglycosylase A
MHVQGSGRVELADGTIRAVSYGGSNGHSYRSLGKRFVDLAIMPKEEVSIPRIRAYFATHPDKTIPMLHENPRYIFFRWGDEQGPRGALGTILTAGRSVAIDHSALPTGALGYLVSSKPVLSEDGTIDHWRPFGRFVLPQDSGSAIRGPGRVDLFWGNDHYAEIAASHMNEPGELFFLVKKNFDLAE